MPTIVVMTCRKLRCSWPHIEACPMRSWNNETKEYMSGQMCRKRIRIEVRCKARSMRPILRKQKIQEEKLARKKKKISSQIHQVYKSIKDYENIIKSANRKIQIWTPRKKELVDFNECRTGWLTAIQMSKYQIKKLTILVTKLELERKLL